MDNKQLLIKSATLLYRESQLPIKVENSSDLVRTLIEKVKVTEVAAGFNMDRDLTSGLKEIVLEMCNNPVDHEYSLSDLLQRFKIITNTSEKLYEAVEQGLEDVLTESQLKRNITNIKKSLNNHFKEQQISEILDKTASMFRYNREKIKDIGQFITELIDQLEPLQLNTSSKDPAIVGDVDIGNDESIRAAFTSVINKSAGSSILKTGWQGLNRMLQGGIRRGDFMVVPALQHKYKTGFTLSLFQHIARFNKPSPSDSNKKPLLLRITFEDDITNNLQFLYQSIKYDETRTEVVMTGVSVDEMSMYVREKLQVNGYHVKLMRVDPSQWTYRSICNKIVELEAQGYEIELLMLDYLAQIPTTGCKSDGPMGTAMRDLFRRIRNFTGPKNIAVITPHQLSTEAKMLSRTGLADTEFVKEINEKGYYAETKQLDQEVDIELYMHIAKVNKEAYLTLQRGKHRIPTILPDDEKYMMLKFPKNMPIPCDIDGEDSSFKTIPKGASTSSDDLFKM